MIKLFFVYFFVFLNFIAPIICFISYPCGAQSLLASFLTSIKPSNINIDISKNAVPGASCNRPCRSNDIKVCHFRFTLEFYQTLGGACNKCLEFNNTDCFNEQCIIGDGTERTFMSINRQLPGPPIHVCKNDIVVVDVDNQMEGTATTIHWHGLLQHDTPYSDGVPFITQCPVVFGSTFRYAFHATRKGTNLYHSHAGVHKANGLYGALIVREDERIEREKLYDYDLSDFYILCSDWMHFHAEHFFPGLPSTISLFDSILINGYGQYLNKTTNTRARAPIKIYKVIPQKRYLFRLINAASNVCPFQLQIEQHNMTIISTDGNDIEAISADTLYVTSGERFDFVVHTVSSIDDYFIRIRALSPCNDVVEDFAVLRYGTGSAVDVDFVDKKVPGTEEIWESRRSFNFPEQQFEIGQSKGTVEKFIEQSSDETFYLFMATPQLDNHVLFRNGNHMKFMVTSDQLNNNNIGTVNNISLTLPSIPIMLNKNTLNDSVFCDKSNMKNCIVNSTLCSCIHRVKVKLNAVIEFVLIDIDDNSRHPFHLHGHKFYVMEMGQFEDTTVDVVEVLKNRKMERNLKPVLKDTVTIPYKGFVRIKFKANNPGFWLAHCHFDYHLAIGMGFVLQVGDVKEMKEPPMGMSRNCNGFMPEILRI